ncbi:MAG TPA: MaoC/PaaZ C-terminal domain-containing protein [Acidimicrobiales bacterium]|nr:MaoC/PaaZ C-terminal domain-containing protein [Acidimicrobiales bacterium]
MSIEAGHTVETVLVEDLKRTTIVQYAGASGDYNPLHSDEVFTTKVAGYPSVFAHGMLTMGMTGRLVTDLVGAENVTSFGGRFTSQVFPGDTLTGKLVVDSVDGGVAKMTVTTSNQDGVVVFSGQATGKI